MHMETEDTWAKPAPARGPKVTWLHAIAGLLLAVLALTALALMAIPASTFHRPGATRSAELIRQERLAQIEAAVTEETAEHGR